MLALIMYKITFCILPKTSGYTVYKSVIFQTLVLTGNLKNHDLANNSPGLFRTHFSISLMVLGTVQINKPHRCKISSFTTVKISGVNYFSVLPVYFEGSTTIVLPSTRSFCSEISVSGVCR